MKHMCSRCGKRPAKVAVRSSAAWQATREQVQVKHHDLCGVCWRHYYEATRIGNSQADDEEFTRLQQAFIVCHGQINAQLQDPKTTLLDKIRALYPAINIAAKARRVRGDSEERIAAVVGKLRGQLHGLEILLESGQPAEVIFTAFQALIEHIRQCKEAEASSDVREEEEG